MCKKVVWLFLANTTGRCYQISLHNSTISREHPHRNFLEDRLSHILLPTNYLLNYLHSKGDGVQFLNSRISGLQVFEAKKPPRPPAFRAPMVTDDNNGRCGGKQGKAQPATVSIWHSNTFTGQDTISLGKYILLFFTFLIAYMYSGLTFRSWWNNI